MSFFDDFFIGVDSDYGQQKSIRQLQRDANAAVQDATDLYSVLGELSDRVSKLELFNHALIQVIVSKGLLREEEVTVMMQQIDLLDGVEDGKISKSIHDEAPNCDSCGRYINPRRTSCVYCGEVVARTETKKRKPPRPIRKVECSSCSAVVPETSTYFADSGVVCESCFS